MASFIKTRILPMVLLITVLFFTILSQFNMSSSSDVISDVEYLRQQYQAGKDKANQLIIQYNGKEFHDGDQLQKADTQILPQVQIQVETDPQHPHFTLVMADPDAPKRGNERAGPWLHWIQTAFQGNHVDQGKTLADYQGPAPPTGTGPHQYIFLLYKSLTDDVPHVGGPIAVSDSGKRKQFHLKQFEKDHQLHLVATTSYTVIG